MDFIFNDGVKRPAFSRQFVRLDGNCDEAGRNVGESISPRT